MYDSACINNESCMYDSVCLNNESCIYAFCIIMKAEAMKYWKSRITNNCHSSCVSHNAEAMIFLCGRLNSSEMQEMKGINSPRTVDVTRTTGT